MWLVFYNRLAIGTEILVVEDLVHISMTILAMVGGKISLLELSSGQRSIQGGRDRPINLKDQDLTSLERTKQTKGPPPEGRAQIRDF